MRTIQYLIACLTLLSASILASSQAVAQCPNCPTDPQASCPTGVCPSEAPSSLPGVSKPKMALQAGQPARNVGRVAVGAVRVTGKAVVRVATAPVRFVLKRQPVRKVLRGAGRMVTGRGPIMGRLRGKRGC